MENKRIIRNAKWIVICKIAQSLIQLPISMLMARYLGPSNYGLIGYAGAVVAFFVPITMLGLQNTLIKELVETPESEGEIIGTALAMDTVSACLCFVCISLLVSAINLGETETIVVCVLYSISLFFRVLELMNCWFQYKLASKFPSIVMLCSYIVVSLYKIYILVAAKGIYWFAVINSIEFALNGILFVIGYRKLGGSKFAFSWPMMKRLFSRGRFYVLSAMMVTVFQNTDHIMLKTMVGEYENGIYTAAVTCSVVVQFLYTALTDSMRPVVLQCKKNNEQNYEKQIACLYSMIIYMSFVQIAGFSIFSKLVVRILYGEAYLQAASVLRICVWQFLFSYLGVVRNIWILAEGKQNMLWKINLAGMLTNVVGNALMIPYYGAMGAAGVSLLTQFCSNVLLGFVIPSLRQNNRLMLQGLDPRVLLELRNRNGMNER